MTATYVPTERSRIRRKPAKAAYDEAAVHGVLDAGILAHVGYVIEGQPFVTPTAYWREGRKLYWHGSAASRMIRAQAGGLPVCVTVSHLDGLVIGRSAISHSMQFRSVMAFGQAQLVEDLEARRAAMAAFIDRIYPGRAAALRPTTDGELRMIGLVEMEIEEAAAKISAGGVNTVPGDEAWPAWSGVAPVITTIGRLMAEVGQDRCAAAEPSLDLYMPGARLDEVMTAAARDQALSRP